MLAISSHEFFIVACNFARFHTFIIVSNYIDISRKMNYNRNLQFARLERAYELVLSNSQWSYRLKRPHALVVYRKDIGFESHGWDSFLVF